MTAEAIGTAVPVAVVGDDVLEADNLTTTDPDLIDKASGLEDSLAVGALCQQVFELGVSVWRLSRTDAETKRIAEQLSAFQEQVQRVTDQAQLSLRQQIEAAIDDQHGALPKATRESSAALQSAIAKALDTNDRESAASRLVEAVQRQSNESISQAMQELRSLLDASRDDTPLGQLRRELSQDFTKPLSEVRDQVNAVHAVTVDRSARATTPADGIAYEELLGELLNETATAAGDVVTPTGTEVGVGTSKVGDFVIEVTDGSGRTGCFVVEAKDSRLGPKKMREEVDEAAANRNAAASILIVASPEYGWKRQPLQKIAPARYVVVAERDDPSQLAMRVAYQMARADVIASLAEDGDEIDFDFDALRQRLDQARQLLHSSTTIKSALTSSDKQIARARRELETMTDKVMALLADIEADTKIAESMTANSATSGPNR